MNTLEKAFAVVKLQWIIEQTWRTRNYPQEKAYAAFLFDHEYFQAFSLN
jgi:hypothetical protein